MLDALDLYSYRRVASVLAADEPVAALLAAAYARGDSGVQNSIKNQFPGLVKDYRRRYAAPAGLLRGECDGEYERLDNGDLRELRVDRVVASYSEAD